MLSHKHKGTGEQEGWRLHRPRPHAQEGARKSVTEPGASGSPAAATCVPTAPAGVRVLARLSWSSFVLSTALCPSHSAQRAEASQVVAP